MGQRKAHYLDEEQTARWDELPGSQYVTQRDWEAAGGPELAYQKQLRRAGQGPKFIELPGLIVYRMNHIREWEASRLRTRMVHREPSHTNAASAAAAVTGRTRVPSSELSRATRPYAEQGA